MTYSKEIYWLNKDSRKFLERGYLLPGVTPEQRIEQIAWHAENLLNDMGIKREDLKGWFANKFIEYMHKGYYSLSSPVWSNYGLDRGLPISCFGLTIQDETADILRAVAETGMLSKYGGGTAGYFGNLRGRGATIRDNGTSNGAVSFMEMFDTTMKVISQGSTRRGSFAAYYPIDGPDFYEFMEIRSEGNKIQDLSMAVTVPEGWMQSMIDGDKEKRKRWAAVLKKRTETGYPYIFFDDNVNSKRPQAYKDKNMFIKHSQLCSEILEYTDENKTFTCGLSSINLLHWDEIKEDREVLNYLAMFMDSVMEEFIRKSKNIPFLEKARNFAIEHRSIGIGVLGWHSYLQSKMIPFEGIEAKLLNATIFKTLKDWGDTISADLAWIFGSPKVMEGYNKRFSTMFAIAPTTSSSFILGQVSPSIEALISNYFIKDLAKGKFVFKNPYLKEVLKAYKKDTPEIWQSILMKGGSVQHLDFLSEREKMVFKTFGEISQLEIVQQAAQRQNFIDQGQSLNLMIHPEVSTKELNSLMIEAWRLGIKTLYYQRSANLAQEVGRKLMECVSCES